MHIIYASENHISALTSEIDAVLHKHSMMQFFISKEDNIHIQVLDKEIDCKAILVGRNIPHSFESRGVLHFTMLVDSTSYLGEQLTDKYLSEKPFYIFKENALLKSCESLWDNRQLTDKEEYQRFIEAFFGYLNIQKGYSSKFDERIKKVLKLIAESNLGEVPISYLANQAALSESRLSHLFKEEAGIPIKNYLVNMKLLRAYVKLFETGNVTEAAMYAGFDSPSHFALTSKNLTGMSARNISKDSVFLKVSSLDIE